MGWIDKLRSAIRPSAGNAFEASRSSRFGPLSTHGDLAAPEGNGANPAPTPLPAFLPWLAHGATLSDAAPDAHEQKVLAHMASLVALPQVPEGLLPRAAELVPQLLALMRKADTAVPLLAKKVVLDPLLTIEVLRLANSPLYRKSAGIQNMEAAITVIGHSGMNRCITKVLFKPILRESSDPAQADMAQRNWERCEWLADQAAYIAQTHHLSAMDGYLAGLLCGTGWKLALASLHQAGIEPPALPGRAFAERADALAFQLFGLAAKEWAITDEFVAFAGELHRHGLQQCRHPVADVLRTAQHNFELRRG